jgi:acetyltransferase-like isoleucine patch superfamily enzyme
MEFFARLGPRLIARVPFSAARVFAYRRFLGCRIGRGVRVGYKTVITSGVCVLGDGASIGRNCVVAAGEFHAGPRARILDGNSFIGKGAMRIGEGVRVINGHYFDLWDNITIGDHSWIAGQASQFWTHGTTRSTADPSIHIGAGVYIGSGSLFAPGAGVADGSLVALGSVVSERFDRSECLIAGNPARVVRERFIWKDNWL